jgi:hypothetical protein
MALPKKQRAIGSGVMKVLVALWGRIQAMPQLKYLAYVAIICAVLMDLYSAKPDTSAVMRVGLDIVALLFAAAGLGGLAMGVTRVRRL